MPITFVFLFCFVFLFFRGRKGERKEAREGWKRKKKEEGVREGRRRKKKEGERKPKKSWEEQSPTAEPHLPPRICQGPKHSGALWWWWWWWRFSLEVLSDSLRSHGLYPWDFPGKNTGVGCHFLLQGSSQVKDRTCIAGSLLHCGQILY